jgi:hypothetical protein
MKQVRKAALQTLEARKPGPKAMPQDPVEASQQLQELRERVAQLEKESSKLRKERDHLQEVADVSKRIIEHRNWGPIPEVDTQKNTAPRRRRGRPSLKNGPDEEAQPPEVSAGAGESTVAPAGDGLIQPVKDESVLQGR